MLSNITIVTGILTIILIILQQRGASLGSGFGASGELHTERRGLEKSIFDMTIMIATIFVISILVPAIFPNIN